MKFNTVVSSVLKLLSSARKGGPGKAEQATKMRKAREKAEAFCRFVKDGLVEQSFNMRARSPFTRLVLDPLKNAGTSQDTPLYRYGGLLEHLEITATHTGFIIGFDKRTYGDTGMSADAFVRMQARGGRKTDSVAARRMFAIALSKAGYNQGAFSRVSKLKQHGGRQGFSTYAARPFFERAALRFITQNHFDKELAFSFSFDKYALVITVK